MGDIAEYYMDLAMEPDAQREADRHFLNKKLDDMERKYILGVLKWPTHLNGKVMVSKMTKAHLANTISFLLDKNKTKVRNKWIELMSYELEKR